MKLRSLWRKRKDVMEFNEKEKTSAVKQQALQALHDENRRLGLYDGVYAIDVLEQENRLLRARNERLEKELKQEQGEPVECETCKGKLCIGEGTKDDPIRSCPSCNPKAQQRKPLTEQGDDESEEKNI